MAASKVQKSHSRSCLSWVQAQEIITWQAWCFHRLLEGQMLAGAKRASHLRPELPGQKTCGSQKMHAWTPWSSLAAEP